jgi:hypothetical protein
MHDGRHRPWRGLPTSELTLAIAIVLAIIALVSLPRTRAVWAGIGAIALALLAGSEIRSRHGR